MRKGWRQSGGHALSLAQENYRNGAITLLDLLETDRNTASARIASASAANDAAQAWAQLKLATVAGAAATLEKAAEETAQEAG
ncbi:TolC family protein [Paracoccus seriniphilus]|uniref:TolC family protein n=1 Tax=Paracoccus seriniphilus TaxID=184748 RepID=UPI00356878FB